MEYKQWPMVYILVLNYNNYPDTLECLYSLEKLAYQNFKVLVIDNASKDDSVNRVKENFPGVAEIGRAHV